MFTRIIVPLDGSLSAESAVPTAGALALRSRATIDLVHVRRPPLLAGGAPMYDTRFDNEEEVHKKNSIAAQAAALATAGLDVQCTQLHGDAADALEQYAIESGADLIVLTSGDARTGMGSLGKVASHLIRSAGVPVLLVRGNRSATRAATEPLFARILVPLDGSPMSERALDLAASLALPGESEFLLTRVVVRFVVMAEPGAGGGVYPGDQDLQKLRTSALSYLESLASEIRALGINVRTLVLAGQSVEQELLALAEAQHVDLIAMSTHARQRVARFFMGSVATALASESTSSILLYHQSERLEADGHNRPDESRVAWTAR